MLRPVTRLVCRCHGFHTKYRRDMDAVWDWVRDLVTQNALPLKITQPLMHNIALYDTSG